MRPRTRTPTSDLGRCGVAWHIQIGLSPPGAAKKERETYLGEVLLKGLSSNGSRRLSHHIVAVKHTPGVHLGLASNLFLVRVALTNGSEFASGDATTANKASRRGLLRLGLGLARNGRR